MEPLRYGRIAHFEEIPGARRTEPCGGTGGQHAAVDMQGVVHGAHCFRRGIARFRGIGEFGIGRKFVRPHQRQGGHGFAPIAFENGGPPGHAAYQRVSSGRAGMKRAVGIGGIQDAQDRLRRGGNGKLRGCPQPFPLGEKLRGHRCPDKREQQQAQNKKAGGGGLPRTSAGCFHAVRIHRDEFPHLNLRVEIFFEFFPGAEEGKALGFHGNLFTGARIAASITAVFLHLKTAEPADLHTAAFKEGITLGER